MPSPFKNFIEIAGDYDADKSLLSTDFGKNAKEELKDFGQDLGEKVKELVKKKPPLKPSGPTPTYQESVLEPKKSGTLYNVTNTHKDVPEITKGSKLFKRVKYRVKGFSVAGMLKNGRNRDYGVVLGDDAGLLLQNRSGSTKSELQATYCVRKNKAEIEYSESNPARSYKVSVFNDDGNSGITASYRIENGLNTVFSADEKSASVKVGYTTYGRYNVDLSAYATTGEDYKKPFIGVAGRVTF